MPLQEFRARVLFVINKKSGRKKIDREKIIREFCTEYRIQAHFYTLGKRNNEAGINEALQQFKPEVAVAVGGDGTVSLLAGLLAGTGIKMCIVPAGSANGMARELNIPADTVTALQLITEGKTLNCDLLQVNKKWLCMHLSDIGLNARLIKYFQEGPVRGFPGYALALLKALNRRDNLKISMQTRHEEVKREAMMLLFANAGKYGTGATINHEGRLDDGWFEVVVVKKIGPAEIWNMFFGKKGFNPQNIELFQARSINVETTRPAHLQVDGEYLGKTSSVTAEVLNDKLQVFIPSETQADEQVKP